MTDEERDELLQSIADDVGTLRDGRTLSSYTPSG